MGLVSLTDLHSNSVPKKKKKITRVNLGDPNHLSLLTPPGKTAPLYSVSVRPSF